MFSQRRRTPIYQINDKNYVNDLTPPPPSLSRPVINDLLICVLILLIKSPPGSLLTMLSRIILVGKDFKGISWKIKIR